MTNAKPTSESSGDSLGESAENDSVTDQSISKDVDTDLQNESEFGGPKGLEPTRYGDWEKSGRCIDF